METIPELVQAAAEQFAGRCAIVDGEHGEVQLSYPELAALCARVGRALAAWGIAPGDRVAIWAPNRYEWIVAAVGAQAAGAVLVPVNTRFKAAEVQFLLARSRARVLFTVGEFLGVDMAGVADGLRSTLPDLAQIVRLDGPDWARLVAQDDGRALPAVSGDDLSDILFTSGTTGKPRGVMTSHRQNLRVVAAWSERVGLYEGDRYLLVNPFFHAFGYKAGWLAALMRGATILPHPVFDPGAVLARIARDRITVLPGPPALYQSLLADPRLAACDRSSLRLAVTGAASIPVDLIRRMRSELGFATVISGYGLTECCGVATMCRHDDPVETIAMTSGRALAEVDVCCVDDRGQPVGPGQPGEVVVRGYNVMRGYLGQPEATREVIDAAGWLHTGDIGVMDERGYLRITDRKKDIFIVGGFNCSPAEIESHLLAHRDLAQAAVIGVPDARLGEVAMAYVVPRPGAEVDGPAISAWCRKVMANYKVPRRVEVVQALPTNAAGKVQKFVLRERAAQFEIREQEVLGERMPVFVRRPRSLRELLERSIDFGDRDYLVVGARRITYRTHAGAVAALARILRRRYGIGPGDRVAILGANSPEWIASFWATTSLGAVAVALNGWWTADEITCALNHCRASVLIGDRKRLARLADRPPAIPVLEMERDLTALWGQGVADPLPGAAIAEDDPAVIVYTSGTTGRPKGVVHTHRNLLALVSLQFYHGARLGLASDGPQRRLTTNPLFHVSGLHTGAVAHLAAGVTSVWTEGRFDPEAVLQVIERERIHGWSPQGAMAFRVINHPGRARYDTSSVTSLGCGGAPVSPAVQAGLREAFPRASAGLAVGYGLTECTGLATIAYGDDLRRYPDSVGRPLPTVAIEIRGGEVCIRGPMVMKEYWADPAATRAAIGRGRWLRTGDLGRLEGGRLYIEGRRDDLIVHSAENVHPAEIEARLAAHPAVAEAAVVGAPSAEHGQEVKAVVVPRAGGDLSWPELAAWCGQVLAPFKVPSRWQRRDQPLPRTASGKVAKAGLETE
jgi:HIP---CoA ligase